MFADAKEKMQNKNRSEAGKRLDEHTRVMPSLWWAIIFSSYLRGKHSLKPDQSGGVTSNNGFSNYTVKVSGSGLITKRNKATLQKVLPTVQTEKLLFGNVQRAVKRADRTGQVSP